MPRPNLSQQARACPKERAAHILTSTSARLEPQWGHSQKLPPQHLSVFAILHFLALTFRLTISKTYFEVSRLHRPPLFRAAARWPTFTPDRTITS